MPGLGGMASRDDCAFILSVTHRAPTMCRALLLGVCSLAGKEPQGSLCPSLPRSVLLHHLLVLLSCPWPYPLPECPLKCVFSLSPW